MEPDRDDAKVARVLAEGPWLRQLAKRIDRARGEDLAQEALLAALAAPAPRGRLRSWLAGILRNVARDSRRREMRRARREERAARRDGGQGPDETAARAEAHARLAAAVRDLPEPYRATVRLHFFEGMSLAGIARREGVKDSTARNRLRRALATLRARLEGEFGGAPLALVPMVMPARRPRLSLARVAAAAALLAGAVYAGTPRESAPDLSAEASAKAEPPPQEIPVTPLPPEPPPAP